MIEHVYLPILFPKTLLNGHKEGKEGGGGRERQGRRGRRGRGEERHKLTRVQRKERDGVISIERKSKTIWTLGRGREHVDRRSIPDYPLKEGVQRRGPEESPREALGSGSAGTEGKGQRWA